MSKCLQCQKEYKSKRPSSKFCSDNCRVKYHRNHKGESKTQKPEVGKIELEVLYNKILDLVGKFEKPEMPINYVQERREHIDRNIEFHADNTIESFPKKRILVRTFEQYRQLKLECENEEDWNILAEEIREAPNLSTKQKQLLLN